MACGFGACFGCVVPLRAGGYLRLCVDGPVLDGAPARRRCRRIDGGRLLRPAPRAPDRQRLGHLRRHRRAPGLRRRRCSSSFPFAAFVSKTITLAPRDGNPPPRLYETPAGLVNSIGLPNKGLRGYLDHDLPELARAAGPADHQRHGLDARTSCRALVEALDERDEVDALELNVSCPNVSTGLDIGADPGELAAVLGEVRPRTAKPLIVKLTPNTADVAAVAQAAQDAGADAVSLINTLRAYAPAPAGAATPPGWATRPAGCPGPAIRAVALAQVRAVAARVSIPVVGMGGVQSGLHAGAHARCGRDARRASAPRASAIRPREHGSHASLTICSQRAGTTSAERLRPPTIDVAETPANAGKTVKQSGSTSTSGRGRGEFGLFALACGPRVCSIAARCRRPPTSPYQALGGTRAIAPSADGRPAARQRDPHAARAAQARPEGGPGVDPRAPARAARVRRDRQGLRHAPRGPEVRPGEGQQDPAAVPDLAEQDHRRPLRAPAHRARRHCSAGRARTLAGWLASSSSPAPPGSARAR